jgi:flagellin
MSLRINTNVAALNAHRQLTNTDAAMSTSMEKLSSGYRINRSSDDAAGLAVANRLRTAGKSLTVATRNVSEAKAMVNVAEGAANQLQGILERMKELATQSASANAANDRDKIQAEFASLAQEITRITDNTNYQGTILLKGGFGNGICGTTTTGFGEAAGATTSDIRVNGAAAGTYTITAGSGYMSITDGNSTQRVSTIDDHAGIANFSLFGISINLSSLHAATDLNNAVINVTASATGGVFQVGSGASSDNQIGLAIGNLTLEALGLNTASLADQASAQTALTTVDAAINTLVGVQGNMGAAINRMTYTYSNLQVSIENMAASESVIRDVDMAAEMVSFTKSQIMMQAGTAMLAQANTSSQNILTLMR